MTRIIEAVPNVSEGRRADVIEALARAFGSPPGVVLLDTSSDPSHNRTVFTAIGDSAALEEAALALFEQAVRLIDLRRHRGEHPRIGAVDVLPFVPIEGVSMEECVALARSLGKKVAERFAVPIFLYEEAAMQPGRSDLAAIRKGEFEGLAEKMKDPLWRPDFGPALPHPSAGASVVGARVPLIAFNVNLGTKRLEVAKAIARAVRASSGGLRYVKALGIDLQEKGEVQVSMNLTDYRKTPMHRAFEMVRLEAERYGVPVVGSEIVGLVPSEALLAAAEHFLRLINFAREQVLEEKLRKALEEKAGSSPG